MRSCRATTVVDNGIEMNDPWSLKKVIHPHAFCTIHDGSVGGVAVRDREVVCLQLSLAGILDVATLPMSHAAPSIGSTLSFLRRSVLWPTNAFYTLYPSVRSE